MLLPSLNFSSSTPMLRSRRQHRLPQPLLSLDKLESTSCLILALPVPPWLQRFLPCFNITGFTARYVDKAHHFAVIYDKHVQAWVFNDNTMTKGLPERGWVPLLMFYE
jgi:hypothetical protein